MGCTSCKVNANPNRVHVKKLNEIFFNCKNVFKQYRPQKSRD